MCLHSRRLEYDCGSGVRICLIGGIQSLHHQVVEFHSLVLLEFLTVFINLEDTVGC
jgi:hypothetical protein